MGGVMASIKTVEERFWKHIFPEPNSGCWLWDGALDKGGYGAILSTNCNSILRAHRVSYEIHYKIIPVGYVVDHLCGVRCCVNPQHLEAVTIGVNSRRGRNGEHWRKKTHCPRGHEYSGDNLYISSIGSRVCRECQRRHGAAWRKRNKGD